MEEDRIIEAITELRADVKYMRDDIKDLKTNRCDEKALVIAERVEQDLKDHLAHHFNWLNLIIPSLIAVGALVVTLAK
jgi:hypothetical protein